MPHIINRLITFSYPGATHEDAVSFSNPGATHEDAVLTIRQAGQEIVFLVCDGFDPALVEGLPADGAFIEENAEVSWLDVAVEVAIAMKRCCIDVV